MWINKKHPRAGAKDASARLSKGCAGKHFPARENKVNWYLTYYPLAPYIYRVRQLTVAAQCRIYTGLPK